MLVRIVSSLILFLTLSTARAGGGMWLPLLLENLNEEEMQAMGMEISAEDIYSINEGSLKDAIVHFGGFCTGEVVSDRGLVLTNHHCGYGAIQDHSTLEQNYLQDGFWAMDTSRELPNPGLFVTFIESMEDVTSQILAGIGDGITEKERARLIQANTASLKASVALSAHEELLVKPFYEGNRYYAFRTISYPDVRLVGAPPSSIGKFGADTDNWEWPRHTGDFSLFRIYTAPDGSPAEYDAANVPMRPKRHLEVSTAGIDPGDFSMIFGFPGTTEQYLPAVAMEQRTEIINPIRIGMRDRSLAVIDSAMRGNEQIRIDYASKQARIANAWKKWRGESQGVEAVNAVRQRRQLEREFQDRLAAKPAALEKYGDLIPKLSALYTDRLELEKTRAYVGELNYNIDLFRIANMLDGQFAVADNNGTEAFRQRSDRLLTYLREIYDGYSPSVDKEVARALLEAYYTELPDDHQARYVLDQLAFADDYDTLIDGLFDLSYLTRGDRMLELLANDPQGFIDTIRGDSAFQYVRQLNGLNEQKVIDIYNEYAGRINGLQRTYMDGLLRFFPERKLYPDANGTLRVSYGKFEGFTGLEGDAHDYMTYLDGVIEKYVPGDYEFDVPERLIELYEQQDFGRYATEEGKMPVCMLGSNHTTGGNSGSPALNGKGQLVGLNFDRTWQSTMSDVYYDPSICRNIMVDIRYILFLIDKFGQAPHLVEEMTLVE
ncbi:peptidase S46-like protein [Neolewinella xylanilytica]|uniref:Dipeptidyl-peptidase n=1 Tax=Neolewinella xylanilytica TaxID=1514080 RepID=A0A2S6I4A3_9BACT|nr:S46 family peptidase [Neolewinella xylanilytica]PPK86004.1 peptidase S46-like protein [Neolewinella xylanilytica]